MKPFVLKIDNQRSDNVYSLLTVAGEYTNLSGITVGNYTRLNSGTTQISGDIVNGGRLYFVTSKRGAPKSGVPTPDGNYYFGWVEFSKLPSDCSNGNCQLWINLSNVDVYGLQLALSGVDTCGRPFSCGYMSGATDSINYLSRLFPGATIKTVTGQKKILAPDIKTSAYTSFDKYVNTLVKNSAKMVILSDCASGYTGQLFNGSFQTGDTIVSLVDNSGNTFNIPKTGLTNSIIYNCDGGCLYYNNTYRKDNVDPTQVTGQTKQDYIVGNSLFRDIMIGLHEGYFNPTGVTDNRQFPTDTPFKYGGNSYAKAIHKISNSYGFPYADSNLKVLITADVTTAVTITVCDDRKAVGYCDKVLPPCNIQPKYQFGFGAGSNLGDITINDKTINLDPIAKTFHGDLPLTTGNTWNKMYFSGKTSYILYRTPMNPSTKFPCLDIKVGNVLRFNWTSGNTQGSDPTVATNWNEIAGTNPPSYNLSFPGGCFIIPQGTPPSSSIKKSLWSKIKGIFRIKD